MTVKAEDRTLPSADETVESPTAASPRDESPRTEEYIRRCLNDAEDLKREGNDHFRAKQWDEALAAYRSALGHLPRRREPDSAKGKGRALHTADESEDVGPEEEQTVQSSSEIEEVHDERATVLEVDCAKARAVLNANIGACYIKLEEHKEVVSACTEALKDDPRYQKALQRRAAANEKINSWSSLSAAQEDYKQLLELLPPDSPDLVGIRRSLSALPPRIEAAQKRETAEMLDKLKGLGNNILGNFGLSTDNFQFVPNGQGGYSMNFVR
ncbi:TPR-like protein [Trametes elegans]|nr:TPR-like protein [Trametes elegans]